MLTTTRPTPPRRLRRKEQAGFTLIEVLVAAVLFGMGLIGLAKLQVVGQSYNHSAYLRSQATLQAYDMSDRMRANLEAVGNGDYDALTYSSVPSNPGCISTGNGCSSAQMAQHDARQWHLSNAALLPMGRGTVTASSGRFVINVQWDGDRSGVVNADDPQFTLEMVP